MLLFDRPRRFLGVFDRLVDAVLGFVVVAFVVRGAARGAGAGRVAGDVPGRPRRAARGRRARAFQRLAFGLRLQRRALVGVRKFRLRRLVGVQFRLHLDAALFGADRARQQGVEARFHVLVVFRFERLFGVAATDPAAFARGPERRAAAVGDRHLVRVEAFDRRRDQVGDPLGRPGAEPATGVGGDQHRRGRLDRFFGEELFFGQGERDVGALHPFDLVDRAFEFALERPLVGHFLLEVGGAELLRVEEFEARFGAAERVAFGQRDPRFGDVGGGDADRGAAAFELVGDALFGQDFGDLAGFGGFDPGRQRRVALLRRHLEEDEDEDQDRQPGAAEGDFAAR